MLTPIILSDEQVRLLQEASAPVVFFDSSGNKVAEIPAIGSPAIGSPASEPNLAADDAWIAEAEKRVERARRQGMQGSTTPEMLARLRTVKPE